MYADAGDLPPPQNNSHFNLLQSHLLYVGPFFQSASGKRNTMEGNKARFSAIDAYIATFPKDIQEILEALRATIRAAAPDAEEKISYQIPTFTLKGNLVHFAAFKHHIGFYPTSHVIEVFQDELAPYAGAKGTVRFPIDQPLPMDLISRIVRFRVAENLATAATKSRKTSKSSA